MPVAVRTKSAFILAASLAAAGVASLSPSVRAADQPPAASAASQGTAPSATVYVASSDDLMTDIKYLLMLTDTNEQKQWKVLKDYLDVFLIGVDPKLPTRVDVIFDQKANRMVWSIPVSNFPNFRKNNLAAILTPRIREMGGPGWWKLGSGKPADFNGWMQYTAPYDRIGETQNDVNLVPVNPSQARKPFWRIRTCWRSISRTSRPARPPWPSGTSSSSPPASRRWPRSRKKRARPLPISS